MVGHLEQVDVWQALGEELRVDGLLDVTHQEEATRPDLAEQDDRHVVDTGAAVGRLAGHLAPDRPEDAERDLVDLQSIARGEAATDRRAGARQPGKPCRVAGTWPDHAGFEHPADVVAIEQQRHPGDMVLVRMGQDQRVDPTIPRRDSSIERHEQPVRIRAAVDEQAAAA